MNPWIWKRLERQFKREAKRNPTTSEHQLALRLAERRLGVPTPETEARVRALTRQQLEDLAEVLLDFTSLDDLTDWLNQHAARE